MAFLLKDRVLESATGTGTGTLTLGGALSEFSSFSGAGFANGDTFPGYIKGVTGSGQWECGTYTWGTGGIVTRTSVVNGSSGAGVAVNFTAGAKELGVSLSAKMITDMLAADAVVLSGSYTPTVANISNVSGTPTATLAYYERNGNVVRVWGTVTVATTTSGLAELSISLPIAPAAIADGTQISGKAASGPATQIGNIRGNGTGGGVAHLAYTALGTGAVQMWYDFSYRMA